MAAPLLPWDRPQKTLVASIVARLLVARQRPSFVDCCLTVCTSQYFDEADTGTHPVSYPMGTEVARSQT
jgi:hypothetical protein